MAIVRLNRLGSGFGLWSLWPQGASLRLGNCAGRCDAHPIQHARMTGVHMQALLTTMLHPLEHMLSS